MIKKTVKLNHQNILTIRTIAVDTIIIISVKKEKNRETREYQISNVSKRGREREREKHRERGKKGKLKEELGMKKKDKFRGKNIYSTKGRSHQKKGYTNFNRLCIMMRSIQ